MAKHVKRSVIPIYLVGAVWLAFGLFLSLHRVSDYLLCAGLSLGAYVLGRAVFPDRSYELPEEKQPGGRRPAQGAGPGGFRDAPAERRHRGSEDFRPD